MRFLAFGLINLAAGLLACVSMIYANNTLARSASDCVAGPTVKIAVSDKIFEIPVNYGPMVLGTDNSTLLHPTTKDFDPHCNDLSMKPLREPILARTIYIPELSETAARAAELPDFHHIRVEIFHVPLGKSFDRIGIRIFNDAVLRTGRRIEDLPQFAGLYAIERRAGAHIYTGPFMSIASSITTPSGNPIVIICARRAVAPAPFEDVPNPQAICTIGYNWSDNIAIRYHFSERVHSIETWTTIDATARTFVKQLMK